MPDVFTPLYSLAQPKQSGVSGQSINNRIEQGTGPHLSGGQRFIRAVITADIHGLALHLAEFPDDLPLVESQLVGDHFKTGTKRCIIVLLRQGLCPVQRQVEVASAVIQFAGLARRGPVLIKVTRVGPVQRLGNDPCTAVVRFFRQLRDGNLQR